MIYTSKGPKGGHLLPLGRYFGRCSRRAAELQDDVKKSQNLITAEIGRSPIVTAPVQNQVPGEVHGEDGGQRRCGSAIEDVAADLNRALAFAQPGRGDRSVMEEQSPASPITRRVGERRLRDLPGQTPSPRVGRPVAFAVAPPGELAGRLFAALGYHGAHGGRELGMRHPVQNDRGDRTHALGTFGPGFPVERECQTSAGVVQGRCSPRSGPGIRPHQQGRNQPEQPVGVVLASCSACCDVSNSATFRGLIPDRCMIQLLPVVRSWVANRVAKSPALGRAVGPTPPSRPAAPPGPRG
jgi:hypothetical protein